MLQELDTPAVVVDLDVMEQNIRTMQHRAKAAGLHLRPHTKTHKSPWIAELQVKAGAAGITVAKLGEAEVMAARGLTDILIAFPLVGSKKLDRLRRLLEGGIRVCTVADGTEAAVELGEVGRQLGRPVEVLLEVNTGQDRCGVLPGEDAVALAAKIAHISGIRLAGLLTHAGHVYAAQSMEEVRSIARREASALAETARAMKATGIPVPDISVGSTPGAFVMEEWTGATECRPGTYVFNDLWEARLGACSLVDCALHVLATVVSRPAPDRAVLDAGSKALALDRCPLHPGHGLIREYPHAVIDRLSEEHGVVLFPPGTPAPSVGERVRILPNHVCPVVNLHDRLFGLRSGSVAKEVPVLARGQVT